MTWHDDYFSQEIIAIDIIVILRQFYAIIIMVIYYDNNNPGAPFHRARYLLVFLIFRH